MDNIVLFTGVYDLFSLRLIRKLYDKGIKTIYCISDEQNSNRLHEIVNNILCSYEKAELLRCMDNIRMLYIDIEEIDIPYLTKFFTGKQISLWHLDKEYSFVHVYGQQILNNNKKIMNNVHNLCKNCNVSDINYLSSIYAENYKEENNINTTADKNDDAKRILEKLKNTNEKFLLEKLKPMGIKINIMRTPIAFKQINENNKIEAVDFFINRFLEFKEWIVSRIPEYFNNNVLTIFSDNSYTINISSINTIINEIVNKYLSKKLMTDEITSIGTSYNMSLNKLITEIDKNESNINIKITDEYDKLNEIDLIFHNILSYYFPYLRVINIDKLQTELPEKNSDNYEVDTNYINNYVKSKVNFNYKDKKKLKKIKKTIRSKNGKELTYYVSGQGEAILIINAYGVVPDAWDKVISQLSKNYYVIIWQARGIYNKEKPNEDPAYIFGVFEQIEDIEEIVDNEKLKSIHIISWCSGVKSALMYCIKHKETVKSQILLAGEYGPYEGSKKHHSKFRENLQLIANIVKDNEKMLDFYLRIIHNGMFNKPIRKYTGENKTYIYEVMPEVNRDILLDAFTTKEKMVNFLNMCMEYYKHDITDLLSTVEIPILFISAEYDQIAPYQQSEWAHRLVTNSKYTRLPGATHLMILERPEDVIDLLYEHMKYYRDVK